MLVTFRTHHQRRCHKMQSHKETLFPRRILYEFNSIQHFYFYFFNAHYRIYRRKYLGMMVAGTWLGAFGTLIPTWRGRWGRFGLDKTIGSCTILRDQSSEYSNAMASHASKWTFPIMTLIEQQAFSSILVSSIYPYKFASLQIHHQRNSFSSWHSSSPAYRLWSAMPGYFISCGRRQCERMKAERPCHMHHFKCIRRRTAALAIIERSCRPTITKARWMEPKHSWCHCKVAGNRMEPLNDWGC